MCFPLLLLVFAAATLVLAQNTKIIQWNAKKQPLCMKTCFYALEDSSGCNIVPWYFPCICTSNAFIDAFKNDTLCKGVCSIDDQSYIHKWFNDACSNGIGAPPTSQTSSTPHPPSTALGLQTGTTPVSGGLSGLTEVPGQTSPQPSPAPDTTSSHPPPPSSTKQAATSPGTKPKCPSSCLEELSIKSGCDTPSNACMCGSKLFNNAYWDDSLCKNFCSPEDREQVSKWYSTICKGPKAPLETPPSPLPTPPPPPKSTNTVIDEKGAWIHGNWKYLVIAGALILVAFCIVLGLAIFFRRRKRSRKKNRHVRTIPLRTFGRSRPKSGESTVPLRPLRPRSPTTYNFPAHLRWYAEDARERTELRVERVAAVKGAQAEIAKMTAGT